MADLGQRVDLSRSAVGEARSSANSAPPPKRARYVPQACNECKRRKVKCDGTSPCQRCVSQGVACSYYRRGRGGRFQDFSSQDEVQVEMRRMQRVLDDWTQRFNLPNQSSHSPQQCREGSSAQHASPGQIRDREPPADEMLSQSSISPSGRGPTSSEFTLDVVRGSLLAMGHPSAVDEEPTDDNRILHLGRRFRLKPRSQLAPTLRHLLDDPLWDIPQHEALRLIKTYTSGAGSMYPIVECESLAGEAEAMYSAVDSLTNGHTLDAAVASYVLNYSTTVLKLVLAIALTMEKKAADTLAERLYDHAALVVSILETPSLQSVIHLVLAALLHFYLDEEVKAGRCVSIAIRLCVELGLNRRALALRNFPGPYERDRAAVVFWSVYMLDRRSCLGMGVPYVLQDNEVDVELPEAPCASPSALLNDQDATLRHASREYLAAMVDFTRLSGKAYGIVSKLTAKGEDLPTEDMERLDYQVLQWHQNLPQRLQLSPEALRQAASDASVSLVQLLLRVALTARFYQLRNLLFRPSLYSEARISKNPAPATSAIHVAKESIHLLWTLDEATPLLRAQVVFWKHFLISAVGVLLLAMVNSPHTHGQRVRKEFHMALDLLRISAAESPLIAKYSKMISGLEMLANKVGFSRSPDAELATREQLLKVPGNELQTLDLQTTTDADLHLDTAFGSAMMDPVDVRNEFATFFNPNAGYADSLFDLPWTDMFLNENPIT